MAGVAERLPAPVDAGMFSALARMQYAALARMRWSMFRNGVRSRKGALELGARVGMMLLYAVMGCGMAFGLGAVAYQITSSGQWKFLPILFWVVCFLWQIVPISLASFQQQFDPGGLLRFPVSFGGYYLLHLIFGLVDASTIIGAFCCTGLLIGVSVVRPDLFGWMALALLVFAAFNVFLVRAIFAWIDRWLAQRRTREIFTAVFFVGLLGMQFLNPALGLVKYQSPNSDAARSVRQHRALTLGPWLNRVIEVQRWLPPGLAAEMLEEAHENKPAQSLESLALLGIFVLGTGGVLAARQVQYLVLVVGIVAILLLVLGDRQFPGKPVALGVVALSIAAATLLGLPALGVPTTGEIPAGLPSLAGPALRLRDVEGIVPLAAGCLLLAYIEGVSAARTFAAKHGYPLDARQELLGIAAANLAAAMGQGFPVAGGLSQSAVNDKAGARTPLALVFASVTLALCLLFLTGLLQNLSKAVLAAVVLTAVYGLLGLSGTAPHVASEPARFPGRDRRAGRRAASWNTSGYPTGRTGLDIVVARAPSRPHVAFLGRVPGTNSYSDFDRHPENEQLPAVIAFRPEASLIYANADAVLETVVNRLREAGPSVRLTVCDLSAAPYLDLAGSRMLHELNAELAGRGIALRIVGAHGSTRDLLRAEGLEEKVGGLDRTATLDSSSLKQAYGTVALRRRPCRNDRSIDLFYG